MDSSEFSKRFDILYNNIMSDQAPGFDDYEKSVFLNKAQLEVLKNHLNPKGNKYTEGFDGSSKRQIDFSSLTVSKTYSLYPDAYNGDYVTTGHKLKTVIIENSSENSQVANLVSVSIATSEILSILNETIEVCSQIDVENYKYQIDLQAFGIAAPNDFNGDGQINIHDVTALTDYILQYDVFADSPSDRTNAISTLVQVLIDGEARQIILSNPVPINVLHDKYCTNGQNLVVVPINSVEYDTLMSRPYKYPPKQQAWRMFINGNMEIVVNPGMIPTQYRIRYVKAPTEFNLTNGVISDIPEILHDEVLQRAVELAKNSWEGNIETTKAFGERSE